MSSESGFSARSFAAPSFAAPAFAAQAVSAPAVATPSMSAPSVSVPSLSTRSFSTLSFPTLTDATPGQGGDQSEERSRARGHAAGYAAGLRAAADEIDARAARLDAEHAASVRDGQAQVDRAIAVLGAAAEALAERTIPVLCDAENTLVSTALELAEAIIGHELVDDEKSARFALGRALGHTTAVAPQSVRLNPDDLAMLDASTLAKAGVDFAADPSLARGDAITEFPDGFLDARIGTALARAKAVLLGGAS